VHLFVLSIKLLKRDVGIAAVSCNRPTRLKRRTTGHAFDARQLNVFVQADRRAAWNSKHQSIKVTLHINCILLL